MESIQNLLDQLHRTQGVTGVPDKTASKLDPYKVTASAPDPSSISTYRAAVKYVARYMSQNERFLARIRSMISEQEGYEAEMYATRQGIIKSREFRIEEQKRMANVRSLTNSTDGQGIESPEQIDADIERALEVHDQRAHEEAARLVVDYARQFKELRVPLFCSPSIKMSLVDQRKLIELLTALALD